VITFIRKTQGQTIDWKDI